MFKPFEKSDLIVETYGGEAYEYYPLGDYVVMAPGVCGGRPTFKYTRIEPRVVLGWLARGQSVEQVVQEFDREHLTEEAIREAISLADRAFSLLANGITSEAIPA